MPASLSDRVQCGAVLICARQRYNGSLPSPAPCGIVWSKDATSSTQATHPIPNPLQTQSTGSPAEGWTWMEHNHREGTQEAQCLVSQCWTVYINITTYFLLVLFSHGSFLKYLVCLVLIVTIFLGRLTTTPE
jgi:hypothetical protein